jgi:hypothetical protein
MSKRGGKGCGKPPPPLVLRGEDIGQGGAGGEAPKKTGCPAPTRTTEMAERLVAWLSEGKSLSSFCRQDDAPDKGLIFDWIDAEHEFAAQVALARSRGLDAIGDLVLDATQESLSPDEVAAAKYRLDARKWYLSKLKPSQFGERVSVDANVQAAVGIVGAVQVQHILETQVLTPERLTRLTGPQIDAWSIAVESLPLLLAPIEPEAKNQESNEVVFDGEPTHSR